MAIPNFSLEYCNEADLDPIEELAWRALEVLQTYSMHDVDANLFESELNIPEQETIDGANSDIENSEYEGEDDDEGLDSLITHLRTSHFEIDDGLSCMMENIVLIVDDNGTLQQMTEPGFVSLRVIMDNDIATVLSDRTLDGIDSRTTQFIFRMPWHDDGCAVFEGFTLDDEDRVDVTDSENAIELLHDFIEDVATTLRQDIRNDAKNDDAYYSVQNTPTSAAQVALMHILGTDSSD